MLPFKATSSFIHFHVCYSFCSCTCLYHPLSVLWLWVCGGSDGCVHLFVCVCLILIYFYIPSLYAALHLFCFFPTPLRRVPLCWLETSLITHRENLVCFRFRWMVVWANGWMDRAERRKGKKREMFEKLHIVGDSMPAHQQQTQFTIVHSGYHIYQLGVECYATNHVLVCGSSLIYHLSARNSFFLQFLYITQFWLYNLKLWVYILQFGRYNLQCL